MSTKAYISPKRTFMFGYEHNLMTLCMIIATYFIYYCNIVLALNPFCRKIFKEKIQKK